MKNILIVTGGSCGHVVTSTYFFEQLKNNFYVNEVCKDIQSHPRVIISSKIF